VLLAEQAAQAQQVVLAVHPAQAQQAARVAQAVFKVTDMPQHHQQHLH
jgi:hypothetical protein